ncbi:MAG: PilZ domain-containing protein [Elusimicrobiota bacterium]|nr:PilZ domain-containing protein [Elusimicrobiota bacterium]
MTRYSKEARRAARQPHDSVLELLDASGFTPSDARLVDVSALGVSFTSTRVFAKGEPIRARLRLLGAGVLEIKGTVVRIKERERGALYAVKFDSVRGKRP